MKKVVVLLVAMMMISVIPVFANDSLIKTNGFYDEFSGKYYTQVLTTVRDRFGTEMQVIQTFEAGKLIATTHAGGRGALAGMTDGALPALINGGSTLGGAAIISGTLGNHVDVNGVASSVSDQAQAQAQSQLQGQAQGQLQSNINNCKPSAPNCNPRR